MRNIKDMIGRRVKHFKGNEYLVMGTVLHTETGETLVVYTDGKMGFARPLEMFMSEVDKEKYPNARQKYRLEVINDEQ